MIGMGRLHAKMVASHAHILLSLLPRSFSGRKRVREHAQEGSGGRLNHEDWPQMPAITRLHFALMYK